MVRAAERPEWSESLMSGHGFGQQVEKLRREMEARLLPQGFTVTLQEWTDQDGILGAQADLYITGPVGSPAVSWLVGCWDWPSGASAPQAWLAQLSGRVRCPLDCVVAASKTGFTSEARNYARTKDILLRTATSMDAIAGDFSVTSVTVILSKVEVLGNIHGRLASPGPEDRITIPYRSSAHFKDLGEPDFESVQHMIERRYVYPTSIDYMAGLEVVQQATCERIVFEHSGTTQCRLVDETDSLNPRHRCVLLEEITVPIQVTRVLLKSNGVLVQAYSEESEPLGSNTAFFFEVWDDDLTPEEIQSGWAALRRGLIAQFEVESFLVAVRVRLEPDGTRAPGYSITIPSGLEYRMVRFFGPGHPSRSETPIQAEGVTEGLAAAGGRRGASTDIPVLDTAPTGFKPDVVSIQNIRYTVLSRGEDNPELPAGGRYSQPERSTE